MFEAILVANRGEIACRVIRTARWLGVRAVAVYSDADASALHVALADEARRIGPAPARDSYLRGERMIEAARLSGAQAIHPGYGFLAENAEFAEACREAGLVFIGPPAAAIRAMGSKSAAKRIMAEAGVPLVPGYHGEEQDADHLRIQAEALGYPVLIKASAGGGGKGMRLVHRPEEFAPALAAARRESLAAFGDDQMLLEKYLQRPRHVEIQVFTDRLGNAVYLFERDCSIQRRHQKIIEEAPAPGMTPELRAAMGQAAVEAARAIAYEGAGTVEFLLAADGSFYFMEMNTRLQVEHPVTEFVTGQDLVAWQLAVAAGEPLPAAQEELGLRGHALEARIYAEQPERDFLPAAGRLTHFRPPTENEHVRVDTGVRQGDAVGVHYDPLIAKLVVWDQDRPAAARRLRRALAAFQVVGVATNLEFLQAVGAYPAYLRGELHTDFVAEHREALLAEPEPATDDILALATFGVLLRAGARAAPAGAAPAADPHSPWVLANGWRLNGEGQQQVTWIDGERRICVTARFRPPGYLLELPGGAMLAQGSLSAEGALDADLAGTRLSATVVRRACDLTVFTRGTRHRLVQHDPYFL
jgi:3-methylcrotonyl-CoA carboxylase alpha subunit